MTHMSKPSSGENGTAPEKAKKSGKPEREASARSEAAATRDAEPSAAAAPGASDAWMRASQVSLIGLFVIALLWCGYVAQPVIVPVLLAWAIATIVLPLVKWMQERGVPRVLAAVIVTLLLITLIVEPARAAIDACRILAGTRHGSRRAHQAEAAEHDAAASPPRGVAEDHERHRCWQPARLEGGAAVGDRRHHNFLRS